MQTVGHIKLDSNNLQKEPCDIPYQVKNIFRVYWNSNGTSIKPKISLLPSHQVPISSDGNKTSTDVNK